MRRTAILLCTGVSAASLASACLAQTEVRLSVIASGGGTVSSGTLTISYTIGQPVAGPVAAKNTGVYAGFWTTFPSAFCQADFNQDGLVNSQDFFDFIGDFFEQNPPADFNRDGFINSQDFFDFTTALFSGC